VPEQAALARSHSRDLTIIEDSIAPLEGHIHAATRHRRLRIIMGFVTRDGRHPFRGRLAATCHARQYGIHTRRSNNHIFNYSPSGVACFAGASQFREMDPGYIEWILVILFVSGLPVIYWAFKSGHFAGIPVVSAIQTLAQAVALILLFTPDAQAWLRDRTWTWPRYGLETPTDLAKAPETSDAPGPRPTI
jgi:hypothetical protein